MREGEIEFFFAILIHLRYIKLLFLPITIRALLEAAYSFYQLTAEKQNTNLFHQRKT